MSWLEAPALAPLVGELSSSVAARYRVGPEEAARLVAEARRRQEALLAAAHAEHERLITDTEVYRTAVARADELGAQTVADVARLRAEVDEYVDTRLADFGTTLERMLRSVEKARASLRDG